MRHLLTMAPIGLLLGVRRRKRRCEGRMPLLLGYLGRRCITRCGSVPLAIHATSRLGSCCWQSGVCRRWLLLLG